MRYKIGRIGTADGVTLIVMLLLPSMYMLEPGLLCRYVGNSAWLAKLIGGGVILGYALLRLGYYDTYAKWVGEQASLPDFLHRLLGRNGALLLMVLWAAVLLVQTALLLRQLADNTVLLALPELPLEAAAMLFGLLAYLLSRRGLEVLLRCGYIFMLLSVAVIALLLAGLSGDFRLTELQPLAGHGVMTTLRWGLLDSGSWLSCMAIFALAPNLQRVVTLRQAVRRGILLTLALKAVMLAALLMLFGSVVAGERLQLFYEAVRTFHLSQYLQRLDSVFIFLWLTGGLICLALTLYMAVSFFGLAFGLADIEPLLGLGAVAAAAIALLPQGSTELIYWTRLLGYEGGALFLLADISLISCAFYLFKRRNRRCRF